MELYRRVFPIIRDGHSTFHGEAGKSWRHPHGWQAVLRTSTSGKSALVVIHTFARPFPQELAIEIPGSGWKIEEVWPSNNSAQPLIRRGKLHLSVAGAFSAVVIHLKKR
jgi:alpha-galactosidase